MKRSRISRREKGDTVVPKSELRNRITYGVIAGLAALLVVLSGGFIFTAFTIVLALIASLEFDKLRGDGKVCFLFCVMPILLYHHPVIALILVLVAIGSVFLAEYTSKRKYPWLVISIVYITIPTISLLSLRALPNGLDVVFWLILLVVTTDVGAYVFGKSFGKTLLAPNISPKKTWEGFWGGAACAALVSWIYTGSLTFAVAGFVIAAVEQMSDLLESAIKRHFGVKDTGNILPGHGGVMDRTDGLVLTAPLVAAASYYGMLIW